MAAITSSIISASITGNSGSSLTRKLSTASDNSLSSSIDDGDNNNEYDRNMGKRRSNNKSGDSRNKRRGGGGGGGAGGNGGNNYHQHHQHHHHSSQGHQQQGQSYSPTHSPKTATSMAGNSSDFGGGEDADEAYLVNGGGVGGLDSPHSSAPSDYLYPTYSPPPEVVDHYEEEDDDIDSDDNDVLTRKHSTAESSSKKPFLADPYELLIRQQTATMNPLLANHVEKVKIRVRIVYANGSQKTEMKDFTPQELLLDILAFEKKTDRGASTALPATVAQRRSFTATTAAPSGNKPPLSINLPIAGSAPIASVGGIAGQPGGSSGTRPSPMSTGTSNNSNVAYDQRDFIPSISQRDIRRLTTRNTLASEPAPYILVRRHLVVLALGAAIKAIIQHNRIIFITQNDNTSGGAAKGNSKDHRFLDLVEKNLKQAYHNAVHQQNLPANEIAVNDGSMDNLGFEITTYESLFNIIMSLIKQQYETCNQATVDLIKQIGNDALLSVSLQDKMRLLKDQVRELTNRCTTYCQLFNEILQSSEYNDDFAYLYLTELCRDPYLYNIPVQEGSRILYSRSCTIETIMDSLLMDFEELERSSHSLVRQLSATESSVALRLEASRNELLVATTIISVISSTIGFTGFITGAFGMNLDNTRKLEGIDGIFAWVICLCFLFIVVVSSAIILYFERSGWLPKHDYWENFKQLQNKATSIVGATPLSQLNIVFEGIATSAVNGVNSVASGVVGGGSGNANGATSTTQPASKLQQRKKSSSNKTSSNVKVTSSPATSGAKVKANPSSSIKHHPVPTNEDGIELMA